jgi:hypothetical protein
MATEQTDNLRTENSKGHKDMTLSCTKYCDGGMEIPWERIL